MAELLESGILEDSAIPNGRAVGELRGGNLSLHCVGGAYPRRCVTYHRTAWGVVSQTMRNFSPHYVGGAYPRQCISQTVCIPDVVRQVHYRESWREWRRRVCLGCNPITHHPNPPRSFPCPLPSLSISA